MNKSVKRWVLIGSLMTPSFILADNLHLKKWLLDEKQRAKIEQQRQAYLTQHKPVKVEVMASQAPRLDPIHKKKLQKMRLDSVTLMPDGRVRLIVNGRWIHAQNQTKLQFKVDSKHPERVIIVMDGKAYLLPVGATFDPNRKKVIRPKISIHP